MDYCPHCDNALIAAAPYCPFCGAATPSNDTIRQASHPGSVAPANGARPPRLARARAALAASSTAQMDPLGRAHALATGEPTPPKSKSATLARVRAALARTAHLVRGGGA